MKRTLMTVFLSLMVCVCGVRAVRADVLIDSGSPPFGQGMSILANQFVAQQFTLPVGATITEIAPFLGSGFGADVVVTMQVTKGIGLETPATSLIAEINFTIPSTESGSAFRPVPTSFFLDAGTYYLVLSSTATIADCAFSCAAWGTPAPTELGVAFIAAGANVNSAFPPASRFLPFTPGVIGDKFGLRISGNPLPPPPPIAHTPLLYVPSTRTTFMPSPVFPPPSVTAHSVPRYNEIGEFSETFVPDQSGGLRNPRAVILGPDGNIYVSSGTSNPLATTGVIRYDGGTGNFMNVFAPLPGQDPFGLAFGPDGHLYVTILGTNEVLRFDGTTGAPMGTFASGGGLTSPRDLVFGPDRDLYVSSITTAASGPGKVIRYNGTTGALIGDFATGVDSRGLVFGPDGNLYVASFNTNSVLRFDGTTGAPMGIFASGGGLDGPVGLRFGPDGNLYVGSFNNWGVLRYNGSTGDFMDIFVHYGKGGLGQPRLFTFFLPVTIDIKPGTDANKINRTHRGVIPVAILSSEIFNATTVDPSSLRLAGASVNSPGKSGKLMCHEEDMGGGPEGSPDGLLDLVCHFKKSEIVLAPGADTAVLTGKAGGVPIRGQDSILQIGN